MTRYLAATLALLLSLAATAQQPSTLVLSADEQAWLAAHPQLRLGVDPERAPFEFIDENGVYRGMRAEYMAIIGQRLGVTMTPVIGLSWTEVLTQAQDKQLDLLPAVMSTPQRREYLNFTHPYLSFPMAIIGRSDSPAIEKLEQLAGKRVAIVAGYITQEILTRRHSYLRLVPFNTNDAALRELSTGGVDYFIDNLAAISYAVERLGLTNLRVAGLTPYQFQLGIGVRNDWPELVGILQKALDSISEAEAEAIRQRWVRLRMDEGIDLKTLLLYFAPPTLAVLAVLLVVILANRRLRREIGVRRDIERQLRLSEEALTESQRTAHIGWWQWDLAKNSLKWSDETFVITGQDPASFVPTPENFPLVVHAEDRAGLGADIERVLRGEGEPYFDREFRLQRPDGGIRHVRSYGRIYGSAIDNSRHFAGVLHDITEQKQQRLELEEKSQTLQTILDNAPLGIWLQNREGRLLFVNNAFCSAVGISEAQFLAVPHYAELYPPEIAASCMNSDAEALQQEGPHVSYEKLPFSDGKPHELEIIKARLVDEQGHPSGLVGLSLDVTAKMEAERQLRQQAYHDELTGLPNRTYLMEQLGKSLALARRHSHYSALLFFDLDNFKIINDTLGHHTGDLLLGEIGKRLRLMVRQEDTVARLGGDEFVIILQELGSDADAAAEQARLIAAKVSDTLTLPYRLGALEHHLTLSIGISMFPLATEDSHDILKFADTAMYQAKEGGRDTIRFFHPSMQQAAEERYRMQNLLRHAIDAAELQLLYQPQFDQQRRLLGAECLLRWHQPELGTVSPARFIPIAEETGLISEIGTWVLRTACTQLKQWQQAGQNIDSIAVNVSPRQFRQANFVEQVQAIVAQSGVDPGHLELELTEGMLLENIDEVTHKIQQLQRMGIRFAIDDFGTGYSSLSYLKRLPLDRLKIDQSFVRDITRDSHSGMIVETIIAMAKHLKLEVIAEGVENEEELAFLREKGCYHYQGYLFSVPLSAEQLTALLGEHSHE